MADRRHLRRTSRTEIPALRLALLFVLVSKAASLLHDGASEAYAGPTTTQMLVGTLTAFALAYGSIAGLFRYVRRHSLYPFTAYLLVLGGLVAGALATGTLAAS